MGDYTLGPRPPSRQSGLLTGGGRAHLYHADDSPDLLRTKDDPTLHMQTGTWFQTPEYTGDVRRRHGKWQASYATERSDDGIGDGGIHLVLESVPEKVNKPNPQVTDGGTAEPRAKIRAKEPRLRGILGC